MKIRLGHVSNSSTSSFLIITSTVGIQNHAGTFASFKAYCRSNNILFTGDSLVKGQARHICGSVLSDDELETFVQTIMFTFISESCNFGLSSTNHFVELCKYYNSEVATEYDKLEEVIVGRKFNPKDDGAIDIIISKYGTLCLHDILKKIVEPKYNKDLEALDTYKVVRFDKDVTWDTAYQRIIYLAIEVFHNPAFIFLLRKWES